MQNTARLAPLVTAFALIALAAGEPTPALGASFTVNATHDAPDATPGDGVCADAGGACTLRAAVEETDHLPGPDSISVPGGTYVLSQPQGASGSLNIVDDLEIIGAGTAATVIRTTNPEVEMHARVFHINCWDRRFNVKFSGLTISGGLDVGTGGGGIYNCGHELSLQAIAFTKNAAASLRGGGILNNGGNVTISDSVFSENWAQDGGAIANAGTMRISNSTFSNNTAVGGTGGIASSGTAELVNVTVTANVNGGVSRWLSGNGGEVKAINSIFANNLPHYDYGSNEGIPADCFGPITSLGHNLSSDASCNLTGPGDISGVDPRLTGLQDNGGATPTHGLYPNSPAIDAGDPAACPPADQRGIGRPQGAACDIGAYEYVPPPPRPPTEPPPADTAPPPPPPTASPTANPTLRIAATPSPSPPTLNLGPTATATQRRVRKPMFTPTLIDAPPVEEETAGTSVSFVASSMMAVGVLGLIGTAVAGGYYWRRRRRGRRPG